MCSSSCIQLAPENEYWTDGANKRGNIAFNISINLGPVTVSTSEPVGKTVENRTLNHFLQNSSEMDCILMGDYLELDDLVDLGSCSSGSSDSSCLTMASEEYFDSMALLKELQDAIDQEMRDSSVQLKTFSHLLGFGL